MVGTAHARRPRFGLEGSTKLEHRQNPRHGGQRLAQVHGLPRGDQRDQRERGPHQHHRCRARVRLRVAQRAPVPGYPLFCSFRGWPRVARGPSTSVFWPRQRDGPRQAPHRTAAGPTRLQRAQAILRPHWTAGGGPSRRRSDRTPVLVPASSRLWACRKTRAWGVRTLWRKT